MTETLRPMIAVGVAEDPAQGIYIDIQFSTGNLRMDMALSAGDAGHLLEMLKHAIEKVEGSLQ
jgi:hypothetical protein